MDRGKVKDWMGWCIERDWKEGKTDAEGKTCLFHVPYSAEDRTLVKC